MGTSARLLCAAMLGVLCTAVFGSAGPLTVGVQLTVTTALVMGGTGHPLVGESADFVGQYVRDALDLFIAPTGALRGDSIDPGGYNVVAVQTPEQFWPVVGPAVFDASVAQGVDNLGSCLQGQTSCKAAYFGSTDSSTSGYVVFGYSQSARIATIVKRNLSASSAAVAPQVSFILVSNPNRPNGGILERFAGLHIPILGVTFDGAMPTGSCDSDGANCRFLTADITWQYDGYADFPRRPLNLLADLNALAGIVYLHPNYTESVAGAIYQGRTGDTSYYLLPAERLPLLLPLAQLGVPAPILDVLDAPLRVIVEWGYDRGVNPGDPAPATLAASSDPVTKVRNLLAAIPVGLDDGLQEAGFGRPLGTRSAGTFGVGVAPPPASSPTPAPTTSSSSPAVRQLSARPQGAAGLKPRTPPRSGLRRPSLGYVGGHGQVDRRNIVGHSRSGRGR
ncbi:PE-PPE domain-containing protein [Mycolicibacterium vinylchloridicum]|uniref:PE-PPE domain-containing protein n=1 Tax=Mycolicibacterium vinylchloridicum TaxID=2736928 RepID=UPI0015CD5D3E|nr:PE-PPE domain-containing protein [Mycolicibacterium vinylchloridicum]